MVSLQAEAITRQIQEATDIVALVSQYVALKAAGANHKALCPFHNEKTPSFNVSGAKQIFKCFGCGAGGDVFKFMQLREGISFLEARALLADRAGIVLEQRGQQRSDGPDKSDLARVNDWAARYFQKQLADPEVGLIARNYLHQRQLNEQTVKSFGLGYAPDSWEGLVSAAGRRGISTALLAAAGLVKQRAEGGFYDVFRHRLMFPIRDLSNRVIAFGGRTLGDDQAKYLNSAETLLFAKGRNLYGLDQAKQSISRNGQAIVVEGYTDCLMAHQHGLTQTVAALGTALTQHQVQLLRRFGDQAVLVFDSDEAGQRAADRAVEVFLSQQLLARLAHLPAGKDPCDFLLAEGREAFEQLLGEAVEVLEYRWQRVARACQASESPGGQLRAVQEFLRAMATSAGFEGVDAIGRGLLLNRIGKLLSLSPQEVHRQLGAARRTVARSTGPEPQRQEGVPVRDAGAGAIRQIVEVLLNEAAYYSKVAGRLDLRGLADVRLAAVAVEIDRLYSAGEKVELAELISRFDDPEYGRLITDLQLAGSRRGNYEATIDGALSRLEWIKLHGELRGVGQELRDSDSGDEKGLERRWSALVSKAREHRHVLPPKALGGKVT